MIGLKRGMVSLSDHEKSWEDEAVETIKTLKEIFADKAVAIEHIGSTSIKAIKAKPIIDIAVGVKAFADVENLIENLENAGFYHREKNDDESQRFFACGSFYNGGEMQTHFIHVVLYNSMEWRNYINFRDYMNTFPEKAKEYERLKIELGKKYPNDRESYVESKSVFITYALRKAMVWSFLGKTVTAEIDRPLGYVHKKETYTIVYPINYGFIPNVLGGDGEELDVYVLGVDEPVNYFTGKVIGIAHRENDVEDKLIAAPENSHFSKEQIKKAIDFQEQYYKTRIEVIDEKF